ncbi:MAG TPA: AMP-binding protein [Casimicrobiaceae bacterium]|nr:AMP-binding protein [Casimicrobiaceae bacterium]
MHSSPAQNLAALLARSARMWPRLPAVASGTHVLHDYASLAGRAARLATAFVDAGLAPGDRVLLVARNVAGYIETLFACWWAGLVAVPVNSKLHPRELAFLLDDSGARWVFADERWCEALAASVGPRVERVIAICGSEHEALQANARALSVGAVQASTPAWLFYTSGTTGRPKGVVISHGNLAAMAQAFLSDVEAVAPGDAILHPAPLSHGSGLYLVPHVARGAVSVVPESGGFDAAEIVALLDGWDRALFFAAPTMVKRLVAAPAIERARLERLKCIVYGGGPMYVEDCKAAFAALGPRLAQIYGQGETPMTITAMDRALLADAIARSDDARIGSVGVAQLGIELRIADDDDRVLPAGTIGEVQVRGPTVMQGYWRNPAATAETLAGGWLHTGDLGMLDADGFLSLKDRSKDLIISGGSNIYPREVEEALLVHADVAEVAVVGRRHPDWGEEVVACIVARNPRADKAALERALDAHCLARIARFKRPKAYVFLDELPKNETGKVLKTALREQVIDA